jgi:hypothetical protein
MANRTAADKGLKGLAYDNSTNSLVATLEDGSTVTADLSSLLTQGEKGHFAAV